MQKVEKASPVKTSREIQAGKDEDGQTAPENRDLQWPHSACVIHSTEPSTGCRYGKAQLD